MIDVSITNRYESVYVGRTSLKSFEFMQVLRGCSNFIIAQTLVGSISVLLSYER